MAPLPLTDAAVHAYVDGRLAPARAAELDEAVANDSTLAARVADFRRQNAMLHEAFDSWLEEPVPPGLVAAARAPGDSAGWRRFAPHFAAGGAARLGAARRSCGRQ